MADPALGGAVGPLGWRPGPSRTVDVPDPPAGVPVAIGSEPLGADPCGRQDRSSVDMDVAQRQHWLNRSGAFDLPVELR